MDLAQRVATRFLTQPLRTRRDYGEEESEEAMVQRVVQAFCDKRHSWAYIDPKGKLYKVGSHSTFAERQWDEWMSQGKQARFYDPLPQRVKDAIDSRSLGEMDALAFHGWFRVSNMTSLDEPLNGASSRQMQTWLDEVVLKCLKPGDVEEFVYVDEAHVQGDRIAWKHARGNDLTLGDFVKLRLGRSGEDALFAKAMSLGPAPSQIDRITDQITRGW